VSVYQLFCWSENYGDLMSKQQKDYRIFNKQVDKARYEAALDQIMAIIPNPNELNLLDFWKSLTNEQIIELSEIPEFDAQGFTYITGRDVPKKISLSGKKVVVIIDGQNFSATID
jgi:hypothetical protein